MDRNPELAKSIKNQDKMVDTLRKQIVVYLSKIAKQLLSEGESNLQISYLFIAAELENLADVIERNILDRAKKLINKDLHFSQEGLDDIKTLGTLVTDNFLKVMKALKENDLSGAREVLAWSGNSWEFQNEFRKKHFKRLNDGLQVSIETTEIHMDLLNHFHRINRHIYPISPRPL
jgi:phosphate:Na+ symporter